MNFDVVGQQEAQAANDDVKVGATLPIPSCLEDVIMSQQHADTSFGALTGDEKANYRQQLQLNQKLIAERFHNDAANATSCDVERGSTASRDEPMVPKISPKTKRMPMDEDNDQSRPGVHFVRHQGLGLNLDSILVRMARASRRPSAAAAFDTSSGEPTTAIVEQYHPNSSRRKCFRVTIATMIVVVLVVIVAVLVIVLCDKGSSQAQGRTTGPAISATSAFDPASLDCSMAMSQTNPHVITQCKCYGEIFKLAPDIKARYEVLSQAFARTLEAEFRDSVESCSPQNQALLWLASRDGSTPESFMKQRYSLALLFILWNGLEWKRADKWLSDANECTWYGVTCKISRVVTEIALSSNNLVGELTGNVSLLANLTSLELDNNNFQNSSIPREINLLTSLKNLKLSSTGINGTIPTELFELGNVLEYFQVDNNNLSGTIPTLIGELVSLGRWMVGNNHLTGTIPSEIGRCTNATRIQINENNIRGAMPSQLGMLTLLEIFSAADNQLTGTIPKEFGSCTILNILVLRNNHLNGTVPSVLGSLPELASVDFSGNQISGTTPEMLCQQTHSSVCEGGCSCNGCNCP